MDGSPVSPRPRKTPSKGKTGTWIHVHCASLGEYEQAAPVIAGCSVHNRDAPILLTFSPSGMEGVSDASVDHVDYLPFDTPGEAHRFARLLQPGDTLLVKYELWPHHLRALRQGGTRVHLVAARFDAGRHPLNRWGGWMRRQLAQLDAIQVQDAESQAVLAQWGLESEITGDPRADRVLQSLSDAIPPQVSAELDRIAAWRGDRRMLIVGSAWEAEWQALTRLDLSTMSDWAMLVVPHDVRGPHVDRWCADPHVIRSSQVEEGPTPKAPASSWTASGPSGMLTAWPISPWSVAVGEVASTTPSNRPPTDWPSPWGPEWKGFEKSRAFNKPVHCPSWPPRKT